MFLKREAIGYTPSNLNYKAEIKILICYILKSIKEPVPETELTQVLHYEGITNYFDAAEAISELNKNECIKETPEGFIVSEKGADLAETLKQTVAITVRERAIKVVARMMARLRHERDTDIEIKKSNKGYDVSMAIIEKDRTLLNLTINVADDCSANFIKERILDDPSYIYAGIIELLTDEEINYKSNIEKP